ncbi:nuclear transport factor 2 family protein [Lyngbya confervoides]|uniref:Nuclear transport factor 2 family protein n=1 Tax=Lyngbya confervoides BDU141951 TaxID=1574623 RepID=A0ABD4T6M6_9CYAN|nr:nuclear transport factor 2 family protein [Lyngbya confervoides]MCM1984217.1 nuclear transport factor 2 family protein [Lyngbya confervoides BDU141951]
MGSPPSAIEAAEPKLAQDSAPPDLAAWVATMDKAANERKLNTLLKQYERDFVHSDGLTRAQMKKAIRNFWQQYDQLTYTTRIDSWEMPEPGVYTTQTTTTISGRQTQGKPQPKSLQTTLVSQQTIQNSRIIRQATLSEKTMVTSGSNPPKVQVNLPESVRAGEEYYFDVIVDEPLGNRILLGAALEETVDPQGHLQPAQFELESLSTGGLFKVGKAPETAQDEWISAILIQDGGMLVVSQRLSVEPRSSAKSNP